MATVEFRHLSTQERLDLIGEIWESLGDSDVPAPVDLRAELDRRNIAFPDERKRAVSRLEVRAKTRPARG
ncbi:addiction module protein [Azospirillum sp. RWY-5-1]|uniref:Addiction module protein n=1 Tax=Azospirillum oleiclasticum TaxID=2735135 RepID=A0ABX2T8R5_9PROT|nr:addiction module protein [Azospirillum oleiclasticum]NYZ11910.1 addiction module protein [Azospirillum oleiclasticum]NYZ19070.1 addiction module protein [Azospirillum oleiclasticum]